MNSKSQRVKSILHLLAWTLLIALAWFLWLSGPERFPFIGTYPFIIGFGIFVGIVSGLPPSKTFLVCFLGFFIIAVLLGIPFFIFEGMVFEGILCGIFGISGAVVRRISNNDSSRRNYLVSAKTLY
jgi:hypothetical protein